MAGAGDVNGDGFDDLLVGAGDDINFEPGRVYLYLGGGGTQLDTVADTTLVGSGPDSFGWSVASAGDTNGDGCADIVVGAPLGTETWAGTMYVYFGAPGPFDTQADGAAQGQPDELDC